jgi:hypothetical protein
VVLAIHVVRIVGLRVIPAIHPSENCEQQKEDEDLITSRTREREIKPFVFSKKKVDQEYADAILYKVQMRQIARLLARR